MEIPISTNAVEVLRQVQGFPTRMALAVARAMDRQNQRTIGYAQRTYLSGPRPGKLGVRTNRLRSSLSASAAVVSGNTITSTIGTNVAYAGVHEHGFDGEVTVRAHKRNIFRTHQTGGGAVFDMRTGRIKRTAKKQISLLQGQATVRSFKRKMKMPARPFLAPAVADNQLAYGTAVSRAIERAWDGGSKS